MPRKITCSGCNTNYTLTDAFKASRVTCKKCGETIDVAVETDDGPDEAPVAARPVAVRTRSAPSGPLEAPKNLRGKRERLLEKGKPVYMAPMFYVCAIAAAVTVYFAAMFQ